MTDSDINRNFKATTRSIFYNMYPDLQQVFNKIMSIPELEKLPDDVALQITGKLIDISMDLKNRNGTDRAMEWCDELAARNLSDSQHSLLEYCRANAWANRRREANQDIDQSWA